MFAIAIWPPQARGFDGEIVEWHIDGVGSSDSDLLREDIIAWSDGSLDLNCLRRGCQVDDGCLEVENGLGAVGREALGTDPRVAQCDAACGFKIDVIGYATV